MQYTGHFKIGAKENSRFNFFMMRSKIIKTTIVVFVIVMVIVTLTNMMRSNDISSALLFALPWAALSAVAFVAFNVILQRLRLNSFYKKKKLQEFEYDITFNADGIFAKSAKGDSSLKYDIVDKIVETNTDFYMHLTDSHIYLLPKAQMSDSGEALSAVLKKYMSGVKLKLK